MWLSCKKWIRVVDSSAQLKHFPTRSNATKRYSREREKCMDWRQSKKHSFDHLLALNTSFKRSNLTILLKMWFHARNSEILRQTWANEFNCFLKHSPNKPLMLWGLILKFNNSKMSLNIKWKGKSSSFSIFQTKPTRIVSNDLFHANGCFIFFENKKNRLQN